MAGQDSFELSAHKRRRSSSVNIRVATVETVLERWITEQASKGHPRDLTVIMKAIDDQLHREITAPSIKVLLETASLAERFAVIVPCLLIKPATVVAALLNCHKRDALVHCPTSQVLSLIEDAAALIRCTITRWRELEMYKKGCIQNIKKRRGSK